MRSSGGSFLNTALLPVRWLLRRSDAWPQAKTAVVIVLELGTDGQIHTVWNERDFVLCEQGE